MTSTRFRWPHFTLTLDRESETVLTRYEDGRSTGGPVVPEDGFHAPRLGLTPLQHRLAHELAHHLVAQAWGVVCPAGGCPILWRAAHGEPQLEGSPVDEWRIQAFAYFAHGANMRHPFEWAALHELAGKGVDLQALATRYRWLLDARAPAIDVA